MTDAKTVREHVSCPEAADMLGLVLEHTDKTFCFLHEEDTPSLHVYEDHWFCYGCGEKGDVIDLVQKYGGVSFGRALHFLAGAVDDLALEPRVRPEAHRETVDLTNRFINEREGGTEAQERARTLVAQRWPSLSLGFLVDSFNVKVAQHALWVPHQGPDGVITGVKTRSLYTGDKKAVTGSTYPQLYRSLWPPTRAAGALLCEGESDTWVAQAAVGDRWRVLGLPSGAKTWRAAYGAELVGYDHVTLALDMDPTGQEAAAMIADRLRLDHGYIGTVHRLELPEGDLADSVAAGWDLSSPLGG